MEKSASPEGIGVPARSGKQPLRLGSGTTSAATSAAASAPWSSCEAEDLDRTSRDWVNWLRTVQTSSGAHEPTRGLPPSRTADHVQAPAPAEQRRLSLEKAHGRTPRRLVAPRSEVEPVGSCSLARSARDVIPCAPPRGLSSKATRRCEVDQGRPSLFRAAGQGARQELGQGSQCLAIAKSNRSMGGCSGPRALETIRGS